MRRALFILGRAPFACGRYFYHSKSPTMKSLFRRQKNLTSAHTSKPGRLPDGTRSLALPMRAATLVLLCVIGATLSFQAAAQSVLLVNKLVASPRTASSTFGRSVAMSGNWAVVGASSDNTDASGANFLSGSGAAFVYEKVSGAWVFRQKLVAPVRGSSDAFGWSVSISEQTLVVGAYSEDDDAAEANP
ncbi:MAG: hypothetical protein EOP50_14510, partial [Sphingobacteriales bacterium]